VVGVLGIGLTSVSMGAVLVRLSQEAPSLAIAAWRMTWASVLLAPWFLWERKRHAGVPWSGLHLLSGLALALHFAFWISSLRYTSVAVSVLLVDTSPVVVAGLSRLFLNERLTRRGLAGLTLTIGGSILLFQNDLQTLGDWRGPALALAGAVGVAVYLMVGRKLRAQASLLQYVFPTYLTAAIALLLLVPASGLPLTGFSVPTWGFLFLLGLVPQCLGHTSYNWSLRYLPATLVATLTLAEPILASLAAWWLLGELPPAGMLPGGVLVAAGILLVTAGGVATRPPAPRSPGGWRPEVARSSKWPAQPNDPPPASAQAKASRE
jgi:drug/metabolite transporter (DMT)-like permease